MSHAAHCLSADMPVCMSAMASDHATTAATCTCAIAHPAALLLPRADFADHPRLGQEQAQTKAKAAVDLSQFCTAELMGPKQLLVPLQ